MVSATNASSTNNFDEFGRQARHLLTLGQISSNVFDARGRLWKQYDCKNQWIEYIYDNYGRTKAKFLFNAGASSPSNSVCYQFNGLGQLTNVIERYGDDASTNSCDGYTAMVGPRHTAFPEHSLPERLMASVKSLPRDVTASAGGLMGVGIALALVPRRKCRQFAAYLAEGLAAQRAWEEKIASIHIPRRRLWMPGMFWRSAALITLLCVVASDPHFAPLWTGRAQCAVPPNASTATTRITSFTYDADNHLIQVNSPEGVINYSYDPATGRQLSLCTANSFFSYGYDALGRLSTVTVSMRNGVSITPDVTHYTYDAVGNRSTMTLPNGIVSSYTYDNLNRLTNLTQMSGTTNLGIYNYGLGVTGRRISATEVLLQEGGGYLTNALAWQYDGLYRLTNEMCTNSLGYGYTNAFSYDLVGNRLVQTRTSGGTVTTTTSTYNANDQLLEAVSGGTTNAYAYDANGSLTNQAVSGTTASYGYDLNNKLSCVTTGGSTTTYQYNDQGIRVRANTSSTKYYLVDQNNRTGYAQVLEELNTLGGAPTISYVLGDDIIGQCGTTTTDPR